MKTREKLKMLTVTINVPDVIAEDYNGDIEKMSRDAYENFILLKRHEGKISLGKAAELLDITYSECYDLLIKKGLPIENVSQEERDESYTEFKEFMKSYKKT